MTRGQPHPPSPKMGNSGSPLAHLSSSSLSDTEGWLQYKLLQPPPHAPNWVFNYYEHYNPSANVGCPLCDVEWLQWAFREDQQAPGLILPPDSPGGGHSSWGPCTCGTCLPWLDAGTWWPVGGWVSLLIPHRRGSRSCPPGGCPSTTAPWQRSRSCLPGGCCSYPMHPPQARRLRPTDHQKLIPRWFWWSMKSWHCNAPRLAHFTSFSRW